MPAQQSKGMQPSRAKIAAILEASEPPKLLLLLASDFTRPERLLNKIIESHEINRDALIRFNAKSLNQENINALERELALPFLFARFRLVIVKSCQDFTLDNRDRFLKLLKQQPTNVGFILLAKDLPKSELLYKHLVKQDAVLELDSLKGQELKRWAMRELTQNGFTELEAEFLERLIELAELIAAASELEIVDILARMIEKFSLYAEGGKAELSDLDNLFKAESLFEEFKLAELIALANTPFKRANLELAFRNLVSSGKSPFMLVAMLQRSFFSYYLIQFALERGVPIAKVRELLGANQWVFTKQIEAAKRFSAPRLRVILASLLGLDSRLKNLSLKPENIFSQWLQESVA